MWYAAVSRHACPLIKSLTHVAFEMLIWKRLIDKFSKWVYGIRLIWLALARHDYLSQSINFMRISYSYLIISIDNKEYSSIGPPATTSVQQILTCVALLCIVRFDICFLWLLILDWIMSTATFNCICQCVMQVIPKHIHMHPSIFIFTFPVMRDGLMLTPIKRNWHNCIKYIYVYYVRGYMKLKKNVINMRYS